jgi:hypothetical protein
MEMTPSSRDPARADRHKRTPKAVRLPDDDVAWLNDYAALTGQSVHRLMVASVQFYRAVAMGEWPRAADLAPEPAEYDVEEPPARAGGRGAGDQNSQVA